MMYQVLVEKQAEKSLLKLSSRHRQTILSHLIKLKNLNQQSSNIKKLHKPLEGYRLRVGNYRVLFLRNSRKRLIQVYLIGHRKNVYH